MDVVISKLPTIQKNTHQGSNKLGNEGEGFKDEFLQALTPKDTEVDEETSEVVGDEEDKKGTEVVEQPLSYYQDLLPNELLTIKEFSGFFESNTQGATESVVQVNKQLQLSELANGTLVQLDSEPTSELTQSIVEEMTSKIQLAVADQDKLLSSQQNLLKSLTAEQVQSMPQTKMTILSELYTDQNNHSLTQLPSKNMVAGQGELLTPLQDDVTSLLEKTNGFNVTTMNQAANMTPDLTAELRHQMLQLTHGESSQHQVEQVGVLTKEKQSEDIQTFKVTPLSSGQEVVLNEGTLQGASHTHSTPARQTEMPSTVWSNRLEIMSALQQQLSMLKENQSATLQLNLYPQHLGKLKVDMKFKNGVIDIQIMVDEVAMKPMIEQAFTDFRLDHALVNELLVEVNPDGQQEAHEQGEQKEKTKNQYQLADEDGEILKFNEVFMLNEYLNT